MQYPCLRAHSSHGRRKNRVCRCTYACIYICVCVCACVFIYAYTHVCMMENLCVCVYEFDIQARFCVHVIWLDSEADNLSRRVPMKFVFEPDFDTRAYILTRKPTILFRRVRACLKMCVWMHMCLQADGTRSIHACMHSCIHTCIHTCIHAYRHTCIHAYRHTCIQAYIHAYICSWSLTYNNIHACMHTWINTHIDTYMHTYIHHTLLKPDSQINIHTRMHTYIIVHAYTRKYILEVWLTNQDAYIRRYMHTNIHTFIHTYIHTYMHTYIHAYIHTHVHTYTHIFLDSDSQINIQVMGVRSTVSKRKRLQTLTPRNWNVHKRFQTSTARKDHVQKRARKRQH